MSVEDLEVAQEMVKVHSFRPSVVNGTEVKMTLLKQNIDLSTPVQDSAQYCQSHKCFLSKRKQITEKNYFIFQCSHRWLFTIFS